MVQAVDEKLPGWGGGDERMQQMGHSNREKLGTQSWGLETNTKSDGTQTAQIWGKQFVQETVPGLLITCGDPTAQA